MHIYIGKTALVLVMAAALFVSAGCSDKVTADKQQKPAPEAAEETESVPEMNPLDKVYMQANELFDSGSTNAALDFLSASLADEALAQYKSSIFNMLIQMHLVAEQAEKADALFLETLASQPEIAADSAGALYDYCLRQGDNRKVIDWTEKIMALKTVPPSLRSAVRWWNWNGYITEGNAAKSIEIASGLIEDAPVGNALEILQRGVDTLINRKDIDVVDKILEKSSKIITSDTQTRDFLLYLKMRLFAVKGKWSEFQRDFPVAARQLDDVLLERLIHRELPASKKNGQTAVSDSICETVINEFSSKSRSMSEAARIWVANAADFQPEALPDRLSVLIGKKMSADFVGNLFYRYFYNVIDNPAIVGEMLSVGERILPAASDEGTRGSIRTLLLDASFVLNDFDAALRYLEQGIPDQTKSWHDMAIYKVKAHKALAENKPREAVEFFRKFMTVIAVGEEQEQVDPSTGVVHTKEMILGRNAKRIGDILAAIPDKDGAKAAYDEARAYYRKTIDSKPDEDTLKVAEKEFAEIPK